MSGRSHTWRVFWRFIVEVRNRKRGKFTWEELVDYMGEHGAGFMITPGWWVQDWIESVKDRGGLVEVAPKVYIFTEFWDEWKDEYEVCRGVQERF